MQRFVCLYAGETRETARLIATTADAKAIQATAKAVLRTLFPGVDPAVRCLTAGKREALKQIISESTEK